MGSDCSRRVMKNNSSDIDSNSSSGDECELGISRARNGNMSSSVATRPNASAGYWLCCIVPLAFASNYLREHRCAMASSTEKMLMIAAAGMCIESLCFFLYASFELGGLLLKLSIAFMPGLLTTLLYVLLLPSTWRFGLFWGFAVTFCYQNAYIRVMRGLPRCFSYGEAALVVQGLMLFILNAVLQLPAWLFIAPVKGDFAELNAIMMCALFCLLVVCWLFATFKWLRVPCCFYAVIMLLLIAVTCVPITRPVPIITLFNFIRTDITRVYIILFYLVLVGLTVGTVWWQLRNEQKASTSIRKIFHVLIVLVYIPGILYQCAFLYIASGVALSIFTVLELVRILEVPPLAQPLCSAFASFSDEKDAGILALTPFCLLIGCSSPIWITPCPCDSKSLLPLFAGILTIGFGDAAASVVGSKFGRTKWRNSSRSLEGTMGFVLVTLFVILCFHLTGNITMSYTQCLSAVIATLITALIEAHTDQIDNLALPLVFYIIVNSS